MKPLLLMILPFCVIGCAPVAVNDAAICDGTAAATTAHAQALAEDGGPVSLKTGVRLVRLLDAGCNR